MQTIEPKGTTEEIEWTFTGTTYPAEFYYLFREDTHLVTGGNDLVSNRIMTATLTEGGLGTSIISSRQTDIIYGYC